MYLEPKETQVLNNDGAEPVLLSKRSSRKPLAPAGLREWRLVVDNPELSRGAFEEMMRYDQPSVGIFRTTNRACTYENLGTSDIPVQNWRDQRLECRSGPVQPDLDRAHRHRQRLRRLLGAHPFDVAEQQNDTVAVR